MSNDGRRLNILVVYHRHATYAMRPAVEDLIECFRRYADHEVFYYNAATGPLPAFLALVRFDLIIFHCRFLAQRWVEGLFERYLRGIGPLRTHPAVKIALPQDEFFKPAVLDDFFVSYGVRHVFSLAPASEWAALYPGFLAKGSVSRILPGYIDDRRAARIEQVSEPLQRDIDIGYRATSPPPWWGRHGQLKAQVGHRVAAVARRLGLVCDISNRDADTFHGDAWYDFLRRCRYVVGAEGGASIIDRDGELHRHGLAYRAAHPTADYAEIEAAICPGQDGNLALFAPGPRNLEACLTRTAQILMEGDYAGVLVAGLHYIPLKRDWSDLESVIGQLDESRRVAMVERAHADIVASGDYTYSRHVQDVVATVAAQIPPRRATMMRRMVERLVKALVLPLYSCIAWRIHCLKFVLKPILMPSRSR